MVNSHAESSKTPTDLKFPIIPSDESLWLFFGREQLRNLQFLTETCWQFSISKHPSWKFSKVHLKLLDIREEHWPFRPGKMHAKKGDALFVLHLLQSGLADCRLPCGCLAA